MFVYNNYIFNNGFVSFHDLEECGVQHTHNNKMIIGTSEAENEMTSRAMKEVFYLGQYSQQPANCFAAVEVSTETYMYTVIFVQRRIFGGFVGDVTLNIFNPHRNYLTPL